LIAPAQIVRGNVQNGQSLRFLRLVRDDSLRPGAGFGLAAILLDGVTEVGLSFSRQLEIVGGEQLDGLIVSALASVVVRNRVLAVVRHVLRGALAQQLQERHLDWVELVREHSASLDIC